jgi:hypothetical protein
MIALRSALDVVNRTDAAHRPALRQGGFGGKRCERHGTHPVIPRLIKYRLVLCADYAAYDFRLSKPNKGWRPCLTTTIGNRGNTNDET